MLRYCWCDVVVNVHSTTEDKTDDVKGSFYEELEHVFHSLVSFLGCGENESTWHVGHYLAYLPVLDDKMMMSVWSRHWNERQEKPKYLEKILLQCRFVNHKFHMT
jgi:hypothetical protein